MSNSTKEIWKDVVDYEGIYQISNKGRLKSLGRHEIAEGSTVPRRYRKERVLKPSFNKIGYVSYYLTKEEEAKRFFAHRLMGIAFLPNPENKLEINHIDGDPGNNLLENIEWATRSENLLHKFGKLGRQQHNSIWITCTTLQFSARSMSDMNREMMKMGLTTKHGVKRLSTLYKKHGNPFKYKGLTFEVIK